MTAQSQVLKIRRPDDWHIHLRDDDMLKTVVPYTSEFYGRAIVMPNLVPPVTTVAAAIAYASALWTPCRPGDFTALMTCYLTDSSTQRSWNAALTKVFSPPPSSTRPMPPLTPATASPAPTPLCQCWSGWKNWGCRCSFTAKSLTPRLIFSIVKRALLRR